MLDLYEEFFKIVVQLDAADVSYAVVGGIAMAFHGEPRFTRDIDILVLSDAMPAIAGAMEALDYSATARPWTFPSTPLTLHRFARASGNDYLSVDFLATSDPELVEMIDGALAADSRAGAVKIVRRSDLVALKRLRNSSQDQADIDRLQDDAN